MDKEKKAEKVEEVKDKKVEDKKIEKAGKAKELKRIKESKESKERLEKQQEAIEVFDKKIYELRKEKRHIDEHIDTLMKERKATMLRMSMERLPKDAYAKSVEIKDGKVKVTEINNGEKTEKEYDLDPEEIKAIVENEWARFEQAPKLLTALNNRFFFPDVYHPLFDLDLI